jgi:hypothetical protein
MYEREESDLRALRKELAVLARDNRLLRVQLEAVRQRAELAEKAAQDGWSFGKAVLKTGRPVKA